MPIIASQHRWKDKDHTPLEDWPEDCYVQWGGRGVVLSQKASGSYRTAFFEAFPNDGGFIRGEGPTIREAEQDALEKFRKESACIHIWSRKGYTNGGAICRRCGGFRSVFNPVVKLQSFRDPPSPSTWMLAAEGGLRPDPKAPKSERYLRGSWLKIRRAGVDLPDFWSAPPDPGGSERDDYAKESRQAIRRFLKDNPDIIQQGNGSGAFGFFTAMNVRSLENLLEEDDDEILPQP